MEINVKIKQYYSFNHCIKILTNGLFQKNFSKTDDLSFMENQVTLLTQSTITYNFLLFLEKVSSS